MRIAVDIMSGDNPPEELIKGALKANKELKVEITLIGSEEKISGYIDEKNGIYARFSESVIAMDDDALSSVRAKRDSSVAIGAELLKRGEADAFVSAGNTGALLAASTITVRKVKGIRRAAIATVIPLEKPFVLVDSGANTDVTAENLCQFAYMGSLYAEKILNIDNPRVALLNNGTEESKGTALVREAYKRLSESTLNFIGNCEGRDIPFGFCDVLVCDGFSGNIVLKLIEGMGGFISKQMKRIFTANIFAKLSAVFTRKGLRDMKKTLDHKEYGGAPLLGIAKPVIKAHGSSDERSFYNAIRQAKSYAESGIIEKLEGSIKNIGGNFDAAVSETD